MSSALEIFRRQMKKEKKNRPPKSESAEKSHFTMSPLLFLAREVAIRRKGAPFEDYRTVTKALVDQQKYAVKRNANVTSMLIGPPGTGKSRLGFLYGKMYVLLTGGEFEYCWDIDEIPYVSDGGHLHVDEWLIPEGEGRVIALQRIKNRFDTARAKRISISVSTPTAPNLPFVSFEATAIAQDWINRMNMFEIRVPLPRFDMVYIGNAIVPVGKDDDMWKKFEAEAKVRKDRVWEEDGAKTIKKMDTKAAAREVLEWVKKQGFEITTKGLASTFAKEVEKENNWSKKKWRINYFTGPDIVNWIMILNEEKTSQRGYTGQIEDLQKALFKRIEEYGINKKHIKWMKLYIKGNIQTDIAAKFNVTAEVVSLATGGKSKLRKVVLGKSFEDIWATKLRSEGKIVRQGGGNTPEPDILILDDKDNIIEVQSLKCQITKSTTSTINRKKFAVSEIKLWESGIPLKLVYFDVIADRVSIVDVDGRANYTFTRKVKDSDRRRHSKNRT